MPADLRSDAQETSGAWCREAPDAISIQRAFGCTTWIMGRGWRLGGINPNSNDF
jgi:hypothetical protein